MKSTWQNQHFKRLSDNQDVDQSQEFVQDVAITSPKNEPDFTVKITNHRRQKSIKLSPPVSGPGSIPFAENSFNEHRDQFGEDAIKFLHQKHIHFEDNIEVHRNSASSSRKKKLSFEQAMLAISPRHSQDFEDDDDDESDNRSRYGPTKFSANDRNCVRTRDLYNNNYQNFPPPNPTMPINLPIAELESIHTNSYQNSFTTNQIKMLNHSSYTRKSSKMLAKSKNDRPQNQQNLQNQQIYKFNPGSNIAAKFLPYTKNLKVHCITSTETAEGRIFAWKTSCMKIYVVVRSN